ncbi:MAG: diguanylate cyclase [Coriobacteriia bacterium]|nr:diguanylate cyclase [Coriobacteriia bacterium]
MRDATADHGRQREPLISRRAALCDGCGGCVRRCPVKALRIVDGHSEVIDEKCVSCGLCVAECGRGGHTVRDDVPEVEALLKSRTPAVALLASEFIAALHPMTVVQIERALEILGFAAVETTVLGEEIVAEAYEQLHARDDMLVSIRSTCPVVVDFVRAFHPALTAALAPIVPPYVAQARLIRALYREPVSIVYVSPCYARKDEVYQAQIADAVDVAIDFLELRRLLSDERSAATRGRAMKPPLRRPGLLKEVSLTDGFPRTTVERNALADGGIQTVRGLADLDRLLSAVAAGEAGPTVVDALNCEGCIDGPAVSPGMSLYAKRSVDSAGRAQQAVTQVSTRALMSVLPAVNIVRSFLPAPVFVENPPPEEIDLVLASGGLSRDNAPDCGACGWDTCVEQAAAILRGDSTWQQCLPHQRALLADSESRLAALETLDGLTGVWNRKALSERLELEFARHSRYDTPLAVLLLDIDAFGAVNDRFGEAVADAALSATAARLSPLLRSTDFIARRAGDQFAVLLPGIDKTEAFAVAEKLRTAVSRQPVSVEADGYSQGIALTVSVGVAAARGAAHGPLTVMEAADAALHDAMAAGGDRTHLAPG